MRKNRWIALSLALAMSLALVSCKRTQPSLDNPGAQAGSISAEESAESSVPDTIMPNEDNEGEETDLGETILPSFPDSDSTSDPGVTLEAVEVEEHETTPLYANRDVNVREGPSSDSAIHGTITAGTRVDAVSVGEYWTEVQWDGGTYYIHTPYLSAEDGSEAEQTDPLAATTPDVSPGKAGEPLDEPVKKRANIDVNVRTEPSADSDIYKTIRAGTEVEVLSIGEYWSAVSMDGGTYYIHTPYLD